MGNSNSTMAKQVALAPIAFEEQRTGRVPKSLLLAIWLIASGVLAFVHIDFPHINLVLGALGIAAGVLILLGR
jgi:hypothetical protein